MAHLIVVRHSIPQPQRDVSSHEWALTAEGRARASMLADRLRRYEPGLVVTSAEQKARETADVLAEALALDLEVMPELGEQRRGTKPWLDSTSEFEGRIRALLRRPGELVYGEETGLAASDRLRAALDEVVGRHRGATVVAVTHGTVMALYLERTAGLDAVDVWGRLGVPAYAVLRLPELELVELVERLE